MSNGEVVVNGELQKTKNAEEKVWAVLMHSRSIHRKTKGKKGKRRSQDSCSPGRVSDLKISIHRAVTLKNTPLPSGEFRDSTLKQALTVSSYIPRN
jgi:hypothetical protein